MSVSASYALTCTVIDTITDTFINATRKTVTIDGMNKSGTLNAGSTPPATQVAADAKAMSTGAGTIDLRALIGTNGAAVDGNGLKLQIAIFENPATNANPITIVGGASNGYLIFGTSGSLVLSPGDACQFVFKDSRPDIDATHKTIDISGTGSQVLNYIFVLG